MIIERFVGWMDSAPEDSRAEAVTALARALQGFDPDDERREAAEAALTCVLDDESETVRHALSNALGADPHAPRHLILALAADTMRVSLPVLMLSPALIDGELAAMVADCCDEQQIAIACRSAISTSLSATLAANACREACLALIMNPAARVSQPAFLDIATRFGDEAEIRKCLLARPDIGMRARILLIEKYALSLLETADGKRPSGSRREAQLQDACDKAVITFAAQIGDEEVGELVVALIDAKRLTPAFLLRSICMGNLALFAHSLSRLSGQPLGRVERVLKDGATNTFIAMYDKAGLPNRACRVFLATVNAWRDHLSAAGEADYAALPYRVTREVLAAYRADGDETVDPLLVLLRRICADAAREKARHQVERMIAAAQTEALPAPDADEASARQEEPEGEPLSETELMEFAVNLADELAEMALADEARLDAACAALEPANTDGAAYTEAGPEPESLAGMEERMAARVPQTFARDADFEEAIILPANRSRHGLHAAPDVNAA